MIEPRKRIAAFDFNAAAGGTLVLDVRLFVDSLYCDDTDVYWWLW